MFPDVSFDGSVSTNPVYRRPIRLQMRQTYPGRRAIDAAGRFLYNGPASCSRRNSNLVFKENDMANLLPIIHKQGPLPLSATVEVVSDGTTVLMLSGSVWT